MDFDGVGWWEHTPAFASLAPPLIPPRGGGGGGAKGDGGLGTRGRFAPPLILPRGGGVESSGANGDGGVVEDWVCEV